MINRILRRLRFSQSAIASTRVISSDPCARLDANNRRYQEKLSKAKALARKRKPKK